MRMDHLTVDEFLRDTDIQAKLMRLFARATPVQRTRLKQIFSNDRSERSPQFVRDPTFQPAWQYLVAESKRNILIKLIKNAHEAVECNPDVIWSPKQAIFQRGTRDEPAIQCLARGLDTIDGNARGLECAHRFALLYIRIELKLRARESGPWPQKGAAAALNSMAEELHHMCVKPRQRVLSWKKRARAFEQIWNLRPGLLLLLGSETNNAFEKVLSEQDVEVYVRCIEANMPDLYTKSVRLDGAARQAFEEGLKAYGGNSRFQQWRDAQREAVTTDQSRALNLLAQAAAQRQDPPRDEYAGAVADGDLVGWVDVTLPDLGTHDCQKQRPLVQVRTDKDGVEQQTFADSAAEPKLKLLKHVICNLGVSSFGETLLLRATEPQRRWSADGHITAVCLEHTAMSNDSASLFLDRDNLMSLLGSAVKHGLLKRQLEQLEWTYRGTGDEFGSPDSDQYIRDSFALLCYICPREEALDPKFTIIMEQLLPALQSMFQYLHYQSGVCIDDELRHDLIETWIATVKAYNFKPSPDMLELLKVGGQLHKSGVPSYLQLALARTQSVILRRLEQYVESDEVINLAIRTFPLEDVRTACFRGLLHLSLAENAILRNQYSTAMEWVDAIELTVAPAEHLQKTALVWHLLEEKWIAMGRIYRYTAQFEKAEEALRPCLNRRRQSSMTNVHHIVRQLADVYVELREYEQAKTLLDHYLGQLREQGKQSSRPYSRLLLSKVDVDIATGDHKNAQALLDEIDQDFGRKPPTTQTEQLDHVRAVIASMRIAMYGDEWDRVLRRSMEALRLANTYSSFTGTNYYKGYILKLRTTAYLSLAHADIAAAEDCGLEPRNFITGVGTYDLEKAHSSLQAAFQSCALPINRILSATPPSNGGV